MSTFLFSVPPVYPRVKVRVQEEEEDQFPSQNNNDSSLFLSLIDSLSKQEKENKINSPPSNSIPRVTKAPKCLSSPKDGGTFKSNKQIGKNMKPNGKVSSVLPPRAVLSSPDNDRMIGSIHKLDCERSSVSKKCPSHNITPRSPPKAKSENVKRSPTIARSCPKIISKGSKIDIVSPDSMRSCSNFGKGSKTRLTGSIRKDLLKRV